VTDAHDGGAAELPSILVVDDDEAFRERLLRAFRDRGYEAVGAADIAESRAAIAAHRFRYAVVDLRLPSGSGLEVVTAIKRAHSETAIVVLTGYGSIATALDAVRLGAAHYLTKPAAIDEIVAGLEKAAPHPERRAPRADEVPSLARVEWEHINRVLADCDGNVSEAARRLGMHRRSLQRKLAKMPVKQ
jgi:two-component system response regulator RegA